MPWEPQGHSLGSWSMDMACGTAKQCPAVRQRKQRGLSDNGLPDAPRLDSAASKTRSCTATSVRGVWAKRSSQRGAKQNGRGHIGAEAPPASCMGLPRCLLPQETPQATGKLTGARHSQRVLADKSSKQDRRPPRCMAPLATACSCARCDQLTFKLSPRPSVSAHRSPARCPEQHRCSPAPAVLCEAVRTVQRRADALVCLSPVQVDAFWLTLVGAAFSHGSWGPIVSLLAQKTHGCLFPG